MDFDEAKRWYDGYEVENGLHIYNPKSVVDSVYRKEIANYWTKTETYESLKDYISMNFDGLKDVIIELLSGEQIKVDTETFENDMVSFARKDDVLTVLVHLGYLAYHKESKQVYIPNEEVRAVLKGTIIQIKEKRYIEALKEYKGNLLLVGINYDKVTKQHTCKIEEVEMD